MLQERKWLGLAFLLCDLVAAEAAYVSAILLRYGQFYPIPPFFSGLSHIFYALLLAVLYLPVLWAFGVHRGRVPGVPGLIKSVFVLAVLVNVLPFYFQSFAFSRIVFLSFCALTLAWGLAWRFVFQLLLGFPAWMSLVRERVLLVGSVPRLPELITALGGGGQQERGRLQIVALAVEGDPLDLPESAALAGQVVPFDRIPEAAVAGRVDVVLLDPEGIRPERWLSLAEKLARVGLGLRILSGLEPDIPFPLHSTGSMDTVDELNFYSEPIAGFQKLAKRGIDLVVSMLVLVAASPVMLLVALAIRFSGRGPVVYRQERIGKNGVPFTLYKFRSMVHGAESLTGPVWSESGDKRVIPGIGHFIRRTGLDELPQFWNVLAGWMSLVGPRPERAFFFETFPQLYRGRLAVKPGLTGLAQVSGRNGMSVEEKVQCDIYYIRHYSLALDVEILWRTSVMLVLQEWRAIFSRGRVEGSSDGQEGKGKPEPDGN